MIAISRASKRAIPGGSMDDIPVACVPTDPASPKEISIPFGQSIAWSIYKALGSPRLVCEPEEVDPMHIKVLWNSARIAHPIRTLKQGTCGVRTNMLLQNARLATGMVGIINQGATCYLNSVLQSLFHMRLLRKIVLQAPVSRADVQSIVRSEMNGQNLDSAPTSSSIEQSGKHRVVLALQSLFQEMMESDSPVSTSPLTRSFGWDSADSFTQHDAQELLRVLLDHVENRLQRTPLARSLPNLIQGIMASTIKCINVDYASRREERFQDIQLDIKGCHHLRESFCRYTAPERLDGANKYAAGRHGKQASLRQVTLTRVPPVLFLQLKRFDYNLTTWRMEKVNSPLAFPETLDVSPFVESPDARDEARRMDALRRSEEGEETCKWTSDESDSEGDNHPSPPSQRSTDAAVDPSTAATARAVRKAAHASRKSSGRMRLHSVMVHRGSATGGHYFAYIRPDLGKMIREEKRMAQRGLAPNAQSNSRKSDNPSGTVASKDIDEQEHSIRNWALSVELTQAHFWLNAWA